MKFEVSDNKIYEIKAIWNNTVFTKKSEIEYLLRLYYLVFWKKNLKEKST